MGRFDVTVGEMANGESMPPGSRGIMEHACVNLTAGGARGAFQLLKGLKEMDLNGDGKVTLSGFKTAVREAGLGLKEADICIIFQVNGRGECRMCSTHA